MNVVVIGAGIIGLTSAYALFRAGHSVTVIERDDGPASRCSHANGGFLAPSHCAPWAAPSVPLMALKSLGAPESPVKIRLDYTRSQLSWLWAMARECTSRRFQVNRKRMMALGFYSKRCFAEINALLGLAYERSPGGILQLGRSQASRTALQPQAETLRSHGVDAVWLEPEQVAMAEPALRDRTNGLVGALHIRDEGAGRCEQFCASLASYLERSGVRFLWRTAVDRLGVEGTQGGKARRLYGVHALGQTVQADIGVVAAGADARRLAQPFFNLPVYPVKGYSMTAALSDFDRAPRHAILDDRSKLAIAPFDRMVRVSGFAEVGGNHAALDRARCAQLVKGFEALYAGVADTGQATFWTGLRPMTPDGTPIIGATNIGGLYMNTGHGTYGWTLCCGSAQLLADTISGAPTALPAADYALSRYDA